MKLSGFNLKKKVLLGLLYFKFKFDSAREFRVTGNFKLNLNSKSTQLPVKLPVPLFTATASASGPGKFDSKSSCSVTGRVICQCHSLAGQAGRSESPGSVAP